MPAAPCSASTGTAASRDRIGGDGAALFSSAETGFREVSAEATSFNPSMRRDRSTTREIPSLCGPFSPLAAGVSAIALGGLGAAAALATTTDGPPVAELGPGASTLPVLTQHAPALVPGGAWFNSKPLTIAGLRGKVVLVDFWTYSCINCLRTLPHLKAWYAAYRKDGLVIVGVHSPEFAFEHVAANVSAAIRRLGIDYPVVQDNEFATWKAYGERLLAGRVPDRSLGAASRLPHRRGGLRRDGARHP